MYQLIKKVHVQIICACYVLELIFTFLYPPYTCCHPPGSRCPRCSWSHNQCYHSPLRRGSSSWPSCTCAQPQFPALVHCVSPNLSASNAKRMGKGERGVHGSIIKHSGSLTGSLTFNSPHSLKKLKSPFMSVLVAILQSGAQLITNHTCLFDHKPSLHMCSQ